MYISILGYNFLDLLYVIIKVRVLRVADLYGRKLYILLKRFLTPLKIRIQTRLYVLQVLITILYGK